VKLTVTHLIGRFPVLYERALLEEISACEGEGIESRTVAFHASGDPVPEKFADLAARVQYLDLAREKGRMVSGIAGLGVGLGYMFLSPRLASACVADSGFGGASVFGRRARLSRLLDRQRPDLLHAQFGHLGLCFLGVIEAHNIPLVLSFRGQDVLLVSRARDRARKRLFEYAARVLVRSCDMRDELLRQQCPAGKIAVHPSGVDVQNIPFKERAFPDAEDEVMILVAGRLVEKKGMADALRALARCRPGPAGPRMRIAGEGPEHARLQEAVSELGLLNRVAFLGKIPHEMLIREMLSAHLFLLPCRTASDGEREGIPNAVKEAQATGLPVLATRHAGIPECVEHGVSGLLAEEGDADAIARNLDEMLSHPERWPPMGRRGRELVVERYDVRRLAPALVSHYHAAAGKSLE